MWITVVGDASGERGSGKEQVTGAGTKVADTLMNRLGTVAGILTPPAYCFIAGG